MLREGIRTICDRRAAPLERILVQRRLFGEAQWCFRTSVRASARHGAMRRSFQGFVNSTHSINPGRGGQRPEPNTVNRFETLPNIPLPPCAFLVGCTETSGGAISPVSASGSDSIGGCCSCATRVVSQMKVSTDFEHNALIHRLSFEGHRCDERVVTDHADRARDSPPNARESPRPLRA